MSRGTRVPITPKVLEWAIDNSGFTPLDISEKLDIELAELEAWIYEGGQPKLTQFKKLSEILKRPSALFLLPEPPKNITPKAEFRHPIKGSRTRLISQEIRYFREATRLQRALSWIRQELELPELDLRTISPNTDVDAISRKLRNSLGVSVSTQIDWRDSSTALRAWRKAFEDFGVYVFLFPMGENSCRGFSVWDPYAPIIAINTAINFEARIFTLFHEFGHLLTRSNSICVSPARHFRVRGGDELERWCERFSASLLLPWNAVTDFMRSHLDWMDGVPITDIDHVRSLARTFKVSLRATTLRLIEKGIANWDLYDEIPVWSDDKQASGGGKGRTRKKMREDWYGTSTTSTFVAAMGNDLISRADALTYLNISDLDLYSIQDTSR